MQALIKAMLGEHDFARLISRIDGGGCPAVLSGISEIHRAHAAAAICAETGRPVVIVCSDEPEARRLAGDVAALTGERASLLFDREYTFYNAEVVSRQLEQARIGALFEMLEGAPVTVTSVAGLMRRAMPPDYLRRAAVEVDIMRTYDPEMLQWKLTLCGYSYSEQVEGPGQFARRGGILDFFSPAHSEPVRLEFFGDDIDSMSFFDTQTQRRTTDIHRALIIPVAEALPSLYAGERGEGIDGLAAELDTLRGRLEKRKGTSRKLLDNIAADLERLREGRSFPAADRYMELIYPMATAVDYISPDAIVLLSEPGRLNETAERYAEQIAEEGVSLLEAGVLDSGMLRFAESWETVLTRLEDFPVIMADSFTRGNYAIQPRAILNITAKRLPSYGGSQETAASDIAHYISSGFQTVIFCQDRRRCESLREFLHERGIRAALDFELKALPGPGGAVIAVGSLSAGMEYPDIRLAVITEGQIIASGAAQTPRRKKRSNRERLQSFTDLTPGDLVVHEHHGIGRYVGITKLQVDGIMKEYVKIAFSGTDSLYVPTTQLDLVSKYIGAGEDAPVRLSKMGGAEWTRVKTRAKTAAREMAKELIKLYAERQRQRGHSFSPDSIWQTEFEERFSYTETEDQLKCVEEIKADMQRPIPMDRLLCGDVGYGKTEVAMRAVMKCALDGYQTAILVPTTVLAQQHYVTAARRFAGYPVNIEVLSRFRTPAQVKAALRGIESGSVDLIIGTHRLIQKDIKFKKLGLLIIDEEQRFGVAHKERLKELATRVDVLTLSATPIPRTLNMALSGIRDMSTIEQPPGDRQPVQTYVLEHDWGVIADAIRREVARGGQVYYLHNRIENIDRTAVRINEMIEGVSVAVAHGRMDEERLSGVMERMVSGEVQVLVCTTIIEAGIDIPNVNTLIIEDADRLGLSQLHQIRGRVGRSSRRAFAYLTYRRGKILTEIAEKRLSAIREFAEFNSGFKIAMRDLEIRGAGSLLGAEQSGHLTSVGYDMYLKLLEEAVLEERGEKPPERAECSADLAVNAALPDSYIPSGEQRMDLYRRIAAIRTEEDAGEMIEELIDRYGDPPEEAVALVNIALLRGEASRAGILEITQKDGWLRVSLSDFDLEWVSMLYTSPSYTGRIRIEAGVKPVIAMKLKGRDVLGEAGRFVKAYAECREKVKKR